MKLRVLAVVAMILASSCTAQTPSLPPVTTTPESSQTPISITTSTAGHTPSWITVKYRSDPVDVAAPYFVFLSGGSSSLVDAAFYDADSKYMIISLDGTAYHYCGLPRRVWAAFATAPSLGRFYRTRIKGNFDCRGGFVPEY